MKDPSLLSPEAQAIASYPGGHNEGFPDTFKQLYTKVYDYILAGDYAAKPDFPTFTDGHYEQVLCEAIERSANEGKWKKLIPVVEYHRKLLDDFRKQFWEYYRKLLVYRSQPLDKQAARLEREFETLFSTVTGYNDLDKRIAKTKAKKDRLLAVLKYPEIPLHNNPAELGARRRVRKRDISFGPRTQDGVDSWDTFAPEEYSSSMTLVATAKKFGVSFYDYVFDRVAEVNALPSLAKIIQQQAPASYPTRSSS